MSKKITLVERILRAARQEESQLANHSYDSLRNRYTLLENLIYENQARLEVVRMKLGSTMPVVQNKKEK